MPDLELCTEAEIRDLVHAFYARVRADAELGPIFDAQVHDWDAHLARLADFWSSVLRGTGRYTGAPMPKHVAISGLSAPLFQRWLALFHTTSAELPNAALRERADAAAERIAQSLWFGYQIANRGGVPGRLDRA